MPFDQEKSNKIWQKFNFFLVNIQLIRNKTNPNNSQNNSETT
jgi:hypothetical protein